MSDPKRFHPPVRVKTPVIGRLYEVNNVRAASEQLLAWTHHGPKWRKAVQTCMAAMEGTKSAADARKAFEAAARESGMLIEP
jgi:hypothetical protein